MKTTIEMHGYEITISESEEGKVMVQALKDGEVIEEFELEGGEDRPSQEEEEMGEEGGEMAAFGEEEDDLGDEMEDDMEDNMEEEDDMEEEAEEEAALESFSAFFKKSKKK
jgi:hypothetical protein